MKSMLSSSTRIYKIAFIETDDISIEKLSLEELVKLNKTEGADFEWKYAIQEIIDKILDLKQFENLSFKSNRDNPNSLAIILRMQ